MRSDEIRYQTSNIRHQTSYRRQKIEDRRQKIENRRQKIEDRRQKIEDRRQKIEDRRQKIEDVRCKICYDKRRDEKLDLKKVTNYIAKEVGIHTAFVNFVDNQVGVVFQYFRVVRRQQNQISSGAKPNLKYRNFSGIPVQNHRNFEMSVEISKFQWKEQKGKQAALTLVLMCSCLNPWPKRSPTNSSPRAGSPSHFPSSLDTRAFSDVAAIRRG